MFDVQVNCTGKVRAARTSERCITLTVESESHGFDADGNFTTFTGKGRVVLYGLPDGMADALIAATAQTEPAE